MICTKQVEFMQKVTSGKNKTIDIQKTDKGYLNFIKHEV